MFSDKQNTDTSRIQIRDAHVRNVIRRGTGKSPAGLAAEIHARPLHRLDVSSDVTNEHDATRRRRKNKTSVAERLAAARTNPAESDATNQQLLRIRADLYADVVGSKDSNPDLKKPKKPLVSSLIPASDREKNLESEEDEEDDDEDFGANLKQKTDDETSSSFLYELLCCFFSGNQKNDADDAGPQAFGRESIDSSQQTARRSSQIEELATIKTGKDQQKPVIAGLEPPTLAAKPAVLLRSETLHEAARTADMESLRVLVDRLPRSRAQRRYFVNELDETGAAPLHYAARYQHVDAAKFLLALGADPNLQTRHDGHTPLHCACLVSGGVRNDKLYSVAATSFLPPHWIGAELMAARLVGRRKKGLSVVDVNKQDASRLPSFASTIIMKVPDSIATPDTDDRVRRSSRASERPPNIPPKKVDEKFASIAARYTQSDQFSMMIEDDDSDDEDDENVTPSYDALGRVIVIPKKRPKRKKKKHVITVIELLCLASADVNAHNYVKQTPLHTAVLRSNISALRELLAMSSKNSANNDFNSNDSVVVLVNVDARDDAKQTPLHYCCHYGRSVGILRMLLRHGADLSAVDSGFNTPVHLACAQGHLHVVNALLDEAERKHGADKVYELLRDEDAVGEIPLIRAAAGEHLKVVSRLIERGSPLVDVRNASYDTPMHTAVAAGNVALCRLIINAAVDVSMSASESLGVDGNCRSWTHLSDEKQAELKSTVLEPLLEAINAHGETSLHRAAALGRMAVATYLLSVGADLEAREYRNNLTPLLLAARNGHAAMVRVLLEHHADLTVVSKLDRNILSLAALENHAQVIEFVFNFATHDADRKQVAAGLLVKVDKFGMQPLHIACQLGYEKVVRVLLANGANPVDRLDIDERTPMHVAARNGWAHLITILYESSSANSIGDEIIHHTDEKGETSLHLAATEGHHEVVVKLIGFGANVAAVNLHRWTPLECAAARGHTTVCRELLKHGAPLSGARSGGHSSTGLSLPLHLACANGHVSTVRLFVYEHDAALSACNAFGQNALDLAIDNNHREVAMLLVRAPRWRDALRNERWEIRRAGIKLRKFRITTLRKLIVSMPDVAYEALNMCIVTHNDVGDSTFRVECDFELLDDTFAVWVHSSARKLANVIVENDFRASGRRRSSAVGGVTSLNADYEPGGKTAATIEFRQSDLPYTDDQIVLKVNHPLQIMVQYQRRMLLGHPLCVSLLEQKWSLYGRYAFYFTFITYGIFLVSLTAYCMKARPVNRLFFATRNIDSRVVCFWWTLDMCPVNTRWSPLAGDTNELRAADVREQIELIDSRARQNPVLLHKPSDPRMLITNGAPLWYSNDCAASLPPTNCSGLYITDHHASSSHFALFTVNRYVLLTLSSLLLSKELLQAVLLRSCDNIFSWLVFLFTILIVIPYDTLDFQFGLELSADWQVITFNLCLAYLQLMLMLRHFPLIGIYIQMVEFVCIDISKFLPVVLLITFAFAISFHLLFKATFDRTLTPDLFLDDMAGGHTPISISPFNPTVISSFIKSMSMLGGEYIESANFMPTNLITKPLLYIFSCVIGRVILDMIKGLGFEDMVAVAAHAELERTAVRIDLALSMERLVPMRWRRSAFSFRQEIYPHSMGGGKKVLHAGEERSSCTAGSDATQKRRTRALWWYRHASGNRFAHGKDQTTVLKDADQNSKLVEDTGKLGRLRAKSRQLSELVIEQQHQRALKTEMDLANLDGVIASILSKPEIVDFLFERIQDRLLTCSLEITLTMQNVCNSWAFDQHLRQLMAPAASSAETYPNYEQTSQEEERQGTRLSDRRRTAERRPTAMMDDEELPRLYLAAMRANEDARRSSCISNFQQLARPSFTI